jgi:DNA primase
MSDVVQQIKDRLNIIDVVSSYVELHKAGKNFKGKSPFTNEKTPSFYVSPERGMYYCFSTSQGGDIFTFIQTMEGVDFKGALKILADKARVELVPVSPEKQTERDRLYALLDAAAEFYQTQLRENDGAQAYLKDRGVLADTIASWRIGFAPGPPLGGWRTTKEYLMNKGFTATELFKAGLIKQADQGKEPYDVFRNRIMFPLFDQSGRVVAFSGRTLDTEAGVPKYVNSPETDLYKKSELLYGYDRAKHGIRQLDFSLLVEGQFDVVMSHQAGYGNTVAVSGTALTQSHVQLLERISRRVVLALDSDKAGIAAARRAADLMLRRGLDVKVAMLPLKDPADIVKEDPKEYKRVIGHSVHVIEWLMKHLIDQGLEARTLKLRAREEVIPYIPLLPNKIDQDHFEQIVAEALGTTKDAVHYEVERCEEKEQAESQKYKSSQAPIPVTEESGKTDDTSRRRDGVVTYLLGILPLCDAVTTGIIQKTMKDILGDTLSELEETVSVSAKAEVLFKAEAMVDEQPKLLFQTEIIHALNQLHTLTVRTVLREAKEELRQAELSGNEELAKALLETVQRAQRDLQLPPYTLELIGVVVKK